MSSSKPAKKTYVPEEPPKVPIFPSQPPPSTFSEKFAQFTIENRWILVLFAVLPLSFIFDRYWVVRDFFVRTIGSHFRKHDETVRFIQAQIEHWRKSGSKNLLCTARPSWMQVTAKDNGPQYKKKDNAILMPLYDILEIDTKRRVVRVEPGVNIGQLTQFLIPRGWTLPIVPELDDLTCGGMLLGYGIEGSGHKYGLWNDIIVSADIIVGDGSLVHCSATENSDLFRALPWSYGGVGFCVAMEIQIIPCKKYCRLIYEPTASIDQMVDRFTEIASAENPHEFLEGLMYDYNNGILTYGDFADEIGSDGYYNPIGHYYKPWFHRHAETIMKKGKTVVEYIPIRHYYHRHTRSLYWEHEIMFPMGNHPIFRYFLGWLMPPKVNFLKYTQTEAMRAHSLEVHVAQDFLLPIECMKEGLKLCHETYEIYPLWLCPHAVFKTEPQGAIRAPTNGQDIEQYVDIGVWGIPGPVTRGQRYDVHWGNQTYEKWLRENRGYQAMYAVSEQTRDEFNEMFDQELYDQVRNKYKCKGVFMDAYDKIFAKVYRKETKKQV
ncbi:24-dehydrocholesterol reductase-like protein [Polychytrium aggregatum]|uniref:24-dehydrocholesterol reductase-like protein n=1 Tax=Polychytrium aggregatum TaxID=110093 RepID=UPI0022FDD52F|nr:24-dehydrocholesterol reductase-like protein [Polychytrium aggregatum]KAI9203019.1 24-dehydrocholesterol reductase-like protein [Polychytrium aggregatum]